MIPVHLFRLLKKTNQRVASERVDCKPINSENANSWVYEETH